ncbi:hypothetical protein CS542_04230 [Pedobacter sp. IW39]|nr:hypothetical protein CS542_04230 [Pedobacter sp. IW39]
MEEEVKEENQNLWNHLLLKQSRLKKLLHRADKPDEVEVIKARSVKLSGPNIIGKIVLPTTPERKSNLSLLRRTAMMRKGNASVKRLRVHLDRIVVGVIFNA